MDLAQFEDLLGQDGESLDEIVAWARERAQQTLAQGDLDPELAALVGGPPVPTATVTTVRAYAPVAPVPLPRPLEQPAAPLPSPTRDDGSDDGNATMPRAPLPPVPQRPEHVAAGDSADDLEMLDEEDLELVEDAGEGSDDEDAGDEDLPARSAEWKRALADAQGE
ncbi:MAG: hypothetical protein K1X88_25830 [Nannocystaceae bacterium]|nr:hypothetical protein [Nannocystaceae bacterium]